ncbi:MAG: ABC transporter ATP-binding protein [Desulfovibrionales bacterium]|nr:ABC transporter ATP-binding protein [Desulfovibrionales bacterium]
MIRLENLCISFPNFSVSDVSLHISKGEFFSIMGPTGSGKTLIMESIAGLVSPTDGTIVIHDTDVTHALPEHRNVSLVYQDHCLFPHLTVLENVMYGQRYKQIPATEGETLAHDLLEMLGLAHTVSRKPARLSGGEKQRVSIARALACKPDVLLLDEPLSSLDPQFRSTFRTLLKNIHAETGMTIIMVTHDFMDALTLAERAAVVHKGGIAQCGTVADIFNKPNSPFVANFVGMTNILPAQFAPLHQQFNSGVVAIRPEHISIRPTNEFPADWIAATGTLEQLNKDGMGWTGSIRCGNQTLTACIDSASMLSNAFTIDTQVCVGFPEQAVHHIPEAS